MFSNNGRISQRQANYFTLLPLFSSGIFFLPYLGAKMWQFSLLPNLILFFIMGILYIICILFLQGSHSYDSSTPENKTCSCLIQGIRHFIRLCFYLSFTLQVLKSAGVPNISSSKKVQLQDILILLPFILIAFFAASKSFEAIGRLYEILSYIVWIPFVIMLAFGVKELQGNIPFHIENIRPLSSLSLGIIPLPILIPMEYYLYTYKKTKRNPQDKHNPYFLSIFTFSLIILLCFFIWSIYGLIGSANDPLVTISIMRSIPIPLGFLERIDVLLIWFYLVNCFILISSSMYFSIYHFTKLKIDNLNILFIPLGTILVLTLYILPPYPQMLPYYIGYSLVIDLPLSILIPMLKNKPRTERIQNEINHS